jgi:hypothetical protein
MISMPSSAAGVPSRAGCGSCSGEAKPLLGGDRGGVDERREAVVGGRTTSFPRVPGAWFPSPDSQDRLRGAAFANGQRDSCLTQMDATLALA